MALKRVLYGVIVCCLLGVAMVAAQDATPEATPAEATPEMTAEATAAATPNTRFTVAGTYTVRQPVGELRRQYLVHVPAKYFETEAPVPLLMVLHGAGGTGEGMEAISGFDMISDKEGFIVAYPDAVEYAWNDGRGDEVSVIDDVGYLAHLIDSVANKANIDRSRVYVAGYSRGGMMSFRLGCALPKQIAALASVASTFPVFVLKECQNTPPKPVMIIQGTDDPVVPWMGAEGGLYSAAESLRYWSEHNRCTALGPILEAGDQDPLDGTRLMTQEGVKCKQPVRLYGVFHGGHTWPGHPFNVDFDIGLTSMDFNASAAIWDFFKTQVLAS